MICIPGRAHKLQKSLLFHKKLGYFNKSVPVISVVVILNMHICFDNNLYLFLVRQQNFTICYKMSVGIPGINPGTLIHG